MPQGPVAVEPLREQSRDHRRQALVAIDVLVLGRNHVLLDAEVRGGNPLRRRVRATEAASQLGGIVQPGIDRCAKLADRDRAIDHDDLAGVADHGALLEREDRPVLAAQ